MYGPGDPQPYEEAWQAELLNAPETEEDDEPTLIERKRLAARRHAAEALACACIGPPGDCPCARAFGWATGEPLPSPSDPGFYDSELWGPS